MHPKRRPPPGNVRIVQSISNNIRSLIVNKQGNLVQTVIGHIFFPGSWSSCLSTLDSTNID